VNTECNYPASKKYLKSQSAQRSRNFVGMSSGEILLILCVYLLLFGAKGVPALAQTLGKAVYQFRNASQEVQNEIMKSTQDIRKQAEVRLDQLDTEPVQSSPPPQRPQQPIVTNPIEETPSDQKV